jgi:hypothetical protein
VFRSLLNAIIKLVTFGQAPDLGRRDRILNGLLLRENLNFDDWLESFSTLGGVSKEVAGFVYQYFGRNQGLPVGCFRPEDRLREDLELPSILWSDWDLDLVEEFQRSFGVNPGRHNGFSSIQTLHDLMSFLSGLL